MSTTSPSASDARPLDVIGTAVPKRDGAEKVTGRTRFLHDLVLPRMAHGKILRARHPHARIVRIDTTRAAALPGVLAVITAADVEQHAIGFAKDHIALKGDKVRCIRDEIAAVAAETEAIAEEAVALIDVEYEELPAVFDVAAALAPGAPLVHDGLGTNQTPLRYQFSHGDVDRAFASAAAVVEGTYRMDFVATACMGTMVAIADWDAQDHLTIWSTTQVPFMHQRELAQALGIGGDRVRVMQPPVGGNFGRGLDLYPTDVIAALLARRVRRPVRVAFERLEEFVAAPGREPCSIRLRTAADAEGRLLARDCHVIIDNGAYVSWGSTTPYVMLATAAGFYRCPNVRLRHDHRLHEQSLLGLHAWLWQPRVDVRSRVADGRPRRQARDGPPRDPPPQRAEGRRREPPGIRDHVAVDDRMHRHRGAGDREGPAAAPRGLAARCRLLLDVPRRPAQLIAVTVLASPLAVEAQPSKVWRVGWLHPSPPPSPLCHGIEAPAESR